MQETNGNEYQSSKFAKTLAVSEAKVGKSFYLVASALGLLPWQEYGGVVDKPSHLHVITYDANALGGVITSLKKLVGAGADALAFRIYNLQDDFRRISESKQEWDFSFYNSTLQAIESVAARTRQEGGVHCLIISSLTGLAGGIERALFGPPGGSGGTKKGFGSDPAKWKALSGQLHELRNYAQRDQWHCIWEAHIDKPAGLGMKEGEEPKESIRVSGEAGRSWGYNVEQVFRIQRSFGSTYKNSKVDEMYLVCRPQIDFIAGGRGVTENLRAQEPDMTEAFHKLGLEVGQWKPGKKKQK